jgi:hypothetical protein
MEFTSLPTLFAYAACSLLSFVFRLILKKTSSPCDDTTCIASLQRLLESERSASAPARSQRTRTRGETRAKRHAP